MNTTRDLLDDKIDAVAARLTHVDDDPAMVSRIVNTLPERSAWPLHWLMPRLAITAALLAASTLVVLRPFDDRSTIVLRSAVLSSAVEMAAAVPEHRTAPALNVRRTFVERSQNERGTIDVPDFEHSLPSIAAVAALQLEVIAPATLPEDAPLTLKPLEIADLPLTADSFSPR